MIENLPIYISLLFGLTTLAALIFLYWILLGSKENFNRKIGNRVLALVIIWLTLQALLTLNHFYTSNLLALPPRIVLVGVVPTLVTIIILFATSKGRQFIDSLPLVRLTYLHSVRIPVEITLYLLFVHKVVPQLMTFEGRNFDIIAGLTAPLIAYFGFVKNKRNRSFLLLWNFICLGLLLNIVINALLAAPTPLQQFAFDQPNKAIVYFPFSWLPSFVVPFVLFAHLTAIRQLIKREEV